MTLKEFKTLLDIHGADLGKWPHDRRVAATAFLDQSEAAKQAFAEAADLDAALRPAGPDLDAARRESLIDGIMGSIDVEEGSGDAPEIATERQAGGKGDVDPGIPSMGAAGALAGLAGVGACRPLPSMGLLAVSMVVGILCGIAATQLTAAHLPVSPVYGGVELWVK